jgi:uncharacterized phage-associated protein
MAVNALTEGSHDARAIANHILDKAPEFGINGLTLMQLLKLVYLAHGWSLAFDNKPLVVQTPQAWQYGPVYPHIYKALNKYGGNAIGERITDKHTGAEFRPVGLTDIQEKVINAVLESYGAKHAFELSNITHQPGGPWDITFRTLGPYKDISLDLMREHYKALKEQRNIQSL